MSIEEGARGENAPATSHAPRAVPSDPPTPTFTSKSDDEETQKAWRSRVACDSLDDNIVLPDYAATDHMMDRESSLSRYVTRETGCESCGTARAEGKGRLDIAIDNTKGEGCRVYL